MITKDNPSMNSTAETIFMSTAIEKILEQCRIREDNIAHEKYQNDLIKTLTSENRYLSDENKSLSDENRSLSDENLRLIKLLEENGIKP